MSTLKVKNIQHPDAETPAISLSATGELTFAEPPVKNLDDIVDVNATSPSSGDALVFDGEDWVNDSTTYQKLSEKNAANGYAGLDGAGKLNANAIPSLAITNTFVVANQSARLALEAEIGDVAVQTDVNDTFILQGSDPTNAESWVEIISTQPTALGDLTNVNVSEASSGDVLVFTGTSWNSAGAIDGGTP